MTGEATQTVQVRTRAERGERVLITTLTKRMAEDLTDYFRDVGIKVRYLHSDIDSLERTALIRDLRLGVFDCLVGINLLREGLDLPEVTLVAVLDADKEGYLRSKTSLIQTCGRAARNVDGRVLLYADRITDSMAGAIEEMERRRTRQNAYNVEHGVTPRTVVKAVRDLLLDAEQVQETESPRKGRKPTKRGGSRQDVGAATTAGPVAGIQDRRQLVEHVAKLRQDMLAAAKQLEFEQAARLRDEIFRLEKLELELL